MDWSSRRGQQRTSTRRVLNSQARASCEGTPEAWRPESVFGQILGSNDLINQRITGEINLDDFEISHTKDDILWLGSQEDDVQEELRKEAHDFMRVAREYRRSATDTRGPTEIEVQTAVEELRQEMESKEFIDIIEIQEVPPPEVIEEANKPILEAAAKEEPNFVATVGQTSCRIYLSTDGSAYDPYYVSDFTTNQILVVANTHHPHWTQLKGSEGVLNFLRHCVYDAIAEWLCGRKNAPVRPETIKLLKDQLLRLPSEIEQTEAGAISETHSSDDDGQAT